MGLQSLLDFADQELEDKVSGAFPRCMPLTGHHASRARPNQTKLAPRNDASAGGEAGQPRCLHCEAGRRRLLPRLLRQPYPKRPGACLQEHPALALAARDLLLLIRTKLEKHRPAGGELRELEVTLWLAPE